MAKGNIVWLNGTSSAGKTSIARCLQEVLADYLEKQIGVLVDQETVRKHLHKLGYVYKRPNWTVRHKVEERDGYLGNA